MGGSSSRFHCTPAPREAMLAGVNEAAPFPRSALDVAQALGHEELLLVRDAAAGLTAVIAIHDTTLGPAVGGTRMRRYASLDEAAVDALRLARAMTYKALLSDVPRGGGKAVI